MSKDLENLQGSWRVTALEVNGQAMPVDALGSAGIVINGGRFISTGMGNEYEGTFEVDVKSRPRKLTMKFDTGPEKGNTNLAIYEIKGDSWKLCIATQGSVRPSRFGTKPGDGFVFETLTRGDIASDTTAALPKRKNQTEANAAKISSSPSDKRLAEFQGEWSMVSGVMNGQAMDKSAVQWVRRITTGDEIAVCAGPQTLMKMTFTIDPSISPKGIDYMNTAGSNKGKTQLGVYEFDGDQLTVCVSSPGAPRPTSFSSEKGAGHTLTVWKRIGPE
jgi:uncharacterized protein (TIGR03067 family)